MSDNERPILIKKVKKVSGGGHHGGAWKVAYADFTTAMMAFFMLLWLLNVTEKEVLEGLADYFSPSAASVSGKSGAGKVLGGTSLSSEGAQSSGSVAIKVEAPPPTAEDNDADTLGRAAQADADQEFESQIANREDMALRQLEEEIRNAVQESPELQQHQDQILIEQTPDGMRIQIVDKDRRAMFEEGTDRLYGYAARLLASIGQSIERLPNRLSVSGHTDAGAFRAGDAYSNWELSSDRANAARRVLLGSGVTGDRFSEVVGKAETQPLFPDNPYRAENRRISILVLREAPVVTPDFGRRR